MKLQGAHLLPGTPAQVWELLNDPERLAKVLPGCERLELIGPDKYKVAVKFAIAAIGGNFSGTVELAEKKPPKAMTIRMESRGAPGFVKGEGAIQLSEKGGQTELKYTGEAHVGGMIAAVGQRMLEGASRKILEQIFGSLAQVLKDSNKR